MKIYFVTCSLKEGGEAVFIDKLSFYLKRRKWNVRTIPIRNKKYSSKIDLENTLSQHFVYGLKSLLTLFKFYIRNNNVISTFHNNLSSNSAYKRAIYKMRNWVILNLVTMFSKKIILLTRQQQLKMEEKILFKGIFNRKSVVINNFIEKESIIKDKENLNDKILFVGRYTPIKGFEDLIKLASELKDVDFSLIGDNNFRSNLPNLKNHGKVNNLKILKYYDKSSILILPSYNEVFPMTILEAMARGLVILVSDIPGMREIIKEGRNGYLFPPGDVEKMKELILYLKNNPQEIERISKNNLKDIWKFTAEKQVKRYIKVYEEVLNEKMKK